MIIHLYMSFHFLEFLCCNLSKCSFFILFSDNSQERFVKNKFSEIYIQASFQDLIMNTKLVYTTCHIVTGHKYI